MQNSESDTTYVYAYLEGLQSTPNTYHVHNFPINGFGDYTLEDVGCGATYTVRAGARGWEGAGGVAGCAGGEGKGDCQRQADVALMAPAACGSLCPAGRALGPDRHGAGLRCRGPVEHLRGRGSGR